MSNPSFSNIDRWFFDYIEGNLSKEQVQKFEEFISNHPELEFDLDSWKATKIQPVEVSYSGVNNLYREEKRKPVAFFWASAICLILLLGGFYFFPSLLQKTDSIKHSDSGEKKINSINNYSPSLKNNLSSINKKDQKKNVLILSNQQMLSKDKKTKSIDAFRISENELIPNFSNQNLTSIQNKVKEKNMDKAFKPSEKSILIADLNPKKINLLDNKISDKKITKSYTRNTDKQSIKMPKIFSKTLKKINRFMYKDLALNNTRIHHVHLPGSTHLDANYSAAGDVSSTRFTSQTRAQWIGQSNQKLSNKLSLDFYSRVLRSGFAFQFDYSHYGNGVIQDWNTSLIYSPKIALSRSFLIEPAVRFKMGNKFLNTSKVEPGQVEWDRNNLQDFYTTGSPVGNKLWYRDLGVSLLMHAKWIYFGIQADNLLGHVDNIYSNNIETPNRAPYHYTAYVGTDYAIPSISMNFSPYLVYEKIQNREESWGGLNMSFKKLTFGGAYSTKNNFATSIGFSFKQFAFTYQFDRTYSSLLSSRSNSHQLTLLLNSKLQKSSRRYITL